MVESITALPLRFDPKGSSYEYNIKSYISAEACGHQESSMIKTPRLV